MRTRRRLRPSCPLCRASAPRAQAASDLQVDALAAAQVRRLLGYSRYETLRREAWSTAASLDSQGSLGELPLFAMGPWKFQVSARHRLRFFEPRYKEMLRQVTASGGKRCFAAILEPSGFEVGARGRICEIVETGEDSNGDPYAVVEGGPACKILEVSNEHVEQGAAPLFHGNMDEVEEEDLSDIMQAVEVDDTVAPLTAATEMVDLLGALGRQLRTMRRRRQLSALLTAGETVGHTGEQHAGTATREDTPEDLRTDAGEEEGIGAMLNLLVSYRNIITQMDRLLVEASLTAEHLGLASEHADDSQSNDHGTRLPSGALIRRAVVAAESRHRAAGHVEPSRVNEGLLQRPRSQTSENGSMEQLHGDELGRNLALSQPQAPQAPCSSAQPFSIWARDQAHRPVGRNSPQTTTVGDPSAASSQVEEEAENHTQEHPLRITSAVTTAAGRSQLASPLQSLPPATVSARRRSSHNALSVYQDSSDLVQVNALQQRRGSSLRSPSLGRVIPNERGSVMGGSAQVSPLLGPGRRRPVPPALRRGTHISLELPGNGMRRVSVQPRQGAVFSRTATASFPMDRRSSSTHG